MPNEIRNGTHRVYGDTVAASLGSGKRVSGGRRLTIAAPKTTVELSKLSFLLLFQISWAKISPV